MRSIAAVFAVGLVAAASGETKHYTVVYQPPLPILDFGGSDPNSPGITLAPLDVAEHGAVSDVLEVCINAEHTYVGDLTLRLTHVLSGVSAVLFDRPGVPASTFGNSDDLLGNYCFSQGDPALPEVAAGDPNDPNDLTAVTPGSYGAAEPWDGFRGVDKFGRWTLTFVDAAFEDSGLLHDWSLRLDNVPEPATLTFAGVAALVLCRRRR